MTFNHFVADNWLMFSVLAVALLLYLLDDDILFMGIDLISPQELTYKINNDAICLDIREDEAYAKGHIAGSLRVLHIDEVTLDTLPNEVVVYCENGVRSGTFALALKKAYKGNIYLLRDGLKSWVKMNYPMVKA
jgi:rhodanese-related sulfurtransferase